MEPDVEPPAGLRGILASVERLDMWLHIALVVLTVTSVWRYINGHGFDNRALVIMLGAGVLLAVYASSPIVGRSRSPVAAPAWCLTLVAIWLVLVALAPSFAWLAVTIAFVALRVLRFLAAALVVAAMMGAVVAAWTRMQGEFDPTIIAGPACIAGLAILAYRLMERDSAARQRLLDDLRDAQGDLADAQHEAGVLAERTRLSREIHDSVAQGLASINLLLQAAEQHWTARPSAAHEYVGQAA
ncbi:MAG: histidine kinase dimerization/phosphoacceptor domain-containing protein, partial [Ilumatobacteraceae bacterium]